MSKVNKSWKKPNTCSTCIHWRIDQEDQGCLDSIATEYGHRLCKANPPYTGPDPSESEYPDTAYDRSRCGRYEFGENGLAQKGTYYKGTIWSKRERGHQ